MSSRSVFKPHLLEKKAFFLLLLAASAWDIRAEESLGDRISCEVRRIFDERRDAVVQVEAYDRHGKLNGTGFFADPAGTIYTLASIVANADEIFILQGERKIPARLLVADPRSGIALVKADCNSSFIPIGDPHKLSLASPVLAIGFPSGLDETPSFGIIGGFDRQFLGRYFMTTHIRANVPVEPGFGGAPLLNLKGEVVGIIFSGIGSGGACYALPIDAAEKIRTDYVRFGEPRHGWIGVTVEEQEQSIDGSTVRVTELGPNTPAAQSGLQDGDILLKVGSVKITKAEDIIDASYFLTAGDKITISVVRNGQKMDIDVKSIKHPVMTDTPLFPQNGMKEIRALAPDAIPTPSTNLTIE